MWIFEEDSVKRHLFFCCGYECLKKEFKDKIDGFEQSGLQYEARWTEKTVRCEGEEWRFLLADDEEKVIGMLLTDYQTCGRCTLSNRLVAILETHIREDLP
jgi:hypothetical protein